MNLETSLPHCQHTPGESAALVAYSERQLDIAAAMCQALSDPARLRLILWLNERERCVSELVELEQAKLGSISARLQTLHNAQLVKRRREAKHVFYSLADAHVRDLVSNILNHAAESL